MNTQKTQNPFLGYPVDELEGFRRMAGFGYLVLAIASFLAMAFFITHNLIGTEKPIWDSVNGLNWSIGQLIYAFIGIAFAFGFNAFTWFFYQTQQDIKARIFVLVVAVTFPMFTEIGQSMTRAEQTRHETATQSATFKTMQKRVETAGTSGTDTALASLVAGASAEKARAETALAQCVERYKSEKSRNQCQRKQEQAISEAIGKMESLRGSGMEARATTSNQLKQDSQTLKDLEHDTDFLQPIVKLLMGLGLPAILASFVIALVIIGSIEVAMSYLGGLLREIKEAMRGLGADISSPKVKARLRESPMVSALHSTGEVIAEQVAQGQAFREQTQKAVFGGSPSPAPSAQAKPALTVREALDRVVSLVRKGKSKGEKFTALEVAKAYKVVQIMEGVNRVPELDLAKITVWLNSQNRPTPTSSEPSAEGTEGSGNTEGKQPSAEGLEVAYLEWLGQVRAGRIKPTIKPSVRWISSKELVKGIKEIEALAYVWLDRAKCEGVIIENPDGGAGKARYILK